MTELLGLLAASVLVTTFVVGVGYAATPDPSQAAAATTVFDLRPAPESTPVRPPRFRVAKPVTIRPLPPPPVTADFVISSFNVLGSSHTTKGGAHSRFGPGVVRARSAASLLNSHQVDVVGFQELQGDQYRTLMGATGGRYQAYPGSQHGRLNSENSIAWRTAVFELVEAKTFAIPYFHGRPREMPVVKLRHKESGLVAWFTNFHNPATTSSHGNNQHWRTVATAKEVELFNELQADGTPVFVTGDMNEREEYFCAVAGGADLVAANGGSHDGSCRPPSHPMPVDWIFGSAQVGFSDYRYDTSPLVRRTTDHPMIVAGAHIEGPDPKIAEAKARAKAKAATEARRLARLKRKAREAIASAEAAGVGSGS